MFVSALMPTRGRSAMAREALACWQAQTYPWRELVVVDDRDCPSFPEGLNLPGVQYHVMDRRMSVGSKRNIACSRAAGEVLMSWDSDDWCAPERMESQIALMQSKGVAFVGYHSMVFVDDAAGEAWKYCGDDKYALGTSFCFKRELWQASPFPDLQIGEDNAFRSRHREQIISVDAGEMLVARIHSENTSDKKANRNPKQWSRVSWPEWFPAQVLTTK
jgi:glycosyltransferase involved in cell wall biosynthesis